MAQRKETGTWPVVVPENPDISKPGYEPGGFPLAYRTICDGDSISNPHHFKHSLKVPWIYTIANNYIDLIPN